MTGAATRRSALTDAELVARAKSGDTTAYDALVRRHQGVAQRAAWLVTGSAEDAADATQEGFVKAWKALRGFDETREFRPWVLRIVVNTARNRRRSAWRFDAMRVRAATTAVREESSAEAVALAHEDQDELVKALRRLSTRDREVVACRYLLELSEAETAQVLGCAPGTVKSRLSRALTRLRGELDPTPAGTTGGAA